MVFESFKIKCYTVLLYVFDRVECNRCTPGDSENIQPSCMGGGGNDPGLIVLQNPARLLDPVEVLPRRNPGSGPVAGTGTLPSMHCVTVLDIS